MSDIVERLRTIDLYTFQEDVPSDEGCFETDLGKEAADEIERLLAQVTGRSGYVFVSSMQEMSDAMTEQRRILREIWGICHVPSGSRHAYTHFQADFDRIRALTKPFAEDA